MAIFDLNQQYQKQQAEQSGGNSIYAKDVKVLRMTLQDEKGDVLFKVLPAHDASTAVELQDGSVQVDPGSMVTFRDAGDNLTQWARYIYTSPFTGHGSPGQKGGRKELISLVSYSSDPNVFCPLQTLINVVKSSGDWKYLVEDAEDTSAPQNKGERAALHGRLTSKLICNVVNYREPAAGAHLGEFPTSAISSFFGERGLANIQNRMVTDELIAQNPMFKYAMGDLTDPSSRGPVLKLKKDTASKKGKYANYVIEPAVQVLGMHAGKPYEMSVSQDAIFGRYNLLDLNSIIPKPTEAQLVAQIVSLFNQWNPSRTMHEYELLREIFGHSFSIPEPPARGAVQGFGQAPAPQVPRQPQMAPQYPQHASVPQVPQQSVQVPGLPRTQPQYQQPTPSPEPGYTLYQSQAQIPQPAPHPVQQPQVQYQQPAPQPQMNVQVPVQQQYQQIPPPVPQPSASHMQQVVMPQNPTGVPMPGDPVPTYNRETFLQSIKQNAAQK